MKNVLLIVGTSLVNAGVPNVIMNIVRFLYKKISFDIIVGSSEPGYFDEEFLSYGGEIIRYDKFLYKDGCIKFVRSGRQLYDIVDQVLKKKKYDAVHCHNGFLAGWALQAAYEQHVPVRISHSHGTFLLNGKNPFVRLFKLISLNKGIKYSTHRLACSDIAGKTLFMGCDFENVLNPINVRSFDFPKQIHKGINLLQIGYYCPLKNQLFSLQVLKELKKRNVEVKMNFIGFELTSGYIDKMNYYISQHGLEGNVNFLPSDYPKEKIFPVTDFLLLPSLSEGLPLSSLESQCSDIYTIVSDVVTKDIDMGICSFLPNNNVEKWVNEIIIKSNCAQHVNRDIIKKFDVTCFIDNILKKYIE